MDQKTFSFEVKSPDICCFGLWLNPSGTLVILVVEIRFSTQREVSWDFMPLACSVFISEGGDILSLIAAVICHPANLLVSRWRKLESSCKSTKQLSYLSEHIRQILSTDYLQIRTLRAEGWMFSQLIRPSDCWIETILMMWGNTISPQPSPFFSVCFYFMQNSVTKRQIFVILFRNIFYRWCQRWNVQSVGPKEGFFFINRDKQ